MGRAGGGGRRGRHEALAFLDAAEARALCSARSDRRSPCGGRCAPCPPCTLHGSRRSAASSTTWAVVQTFGTKCNGRYTVCMTLEPSDHCLRAPRDARDASSCSPAMSFDSLVRRSVTIDDFCMRRACCAAGAPRSEHGGSDCMLCMGGARCGVRGCRARSCMMYGVCRTCVCARASASVC